MRFFVVSYFASTNLEQAVSGEITASMNDSADKIDGWIGEKKQIAVSAANVMAKEDDGTKSLEELRRYLAIAGEDTNEVSDLIVGNRDEQIVGYRAGDLTAKMKPTELRFYKESRQARRLDCRAVQGCIGCVSRCHLRGHLPRHPAERSAGDEVSR